MDVSVILCVVLHKALPLHLALVHAFLDDLFSDDAWDKQEARRRQNAEGNNEIHKTRDGRETIEERH